MKKEGEELIALRMNHISKRYSGIHALDDVSIEMEKGKVNALVGENGAGKSTLMKILAGAEKRDAGTIEIDGVPVEINSTADSQNNGISMIYQELNLVPKLNVAENIFIGNELISHGLFVDKSLQMKETEEILRSLNIDAEPDDPVDSLTVATQQMIEIAKALHQDARIIVMDEPTSSLTESETQELFNRIRELTAKNITIIYISHRMNELFEICDNMTVLRDGQYIGKWNRDEIDEATLIKHMVGRNITAMFPKENVTVGETVLEVSGLNNTGSFQDIGFTIRKGEIVGFAGLIGAGRTEIASAIFGWGDWDSGEIRMNGKLCEIRSPQDAIRCRIGYVPEDRKNLGLIQSASIRQNISVTLWDRIAKGGLVSKKKEIELSEQIAGTLSIKMADIDDLVSSLSGGNQQKVVLAKWLSLNMDLLILDEPTRGIDVGAKSEIHKLVVELARNGVAIMFISSEMPEVMGMSDRIIVMHEGRITGQLNRGEFDQEKIMSYAMGLS